MSTDAKEQPGSELIPQILARGDAVKDLVQQLAGDLGCEGRAVESLENTETNRPTVVVLDCSERTAACLHVQASFHQAHPHVSFVTLFQTYTLCDIVRTMRHGALMAFALPVDVRQLQTALVDAVRQSVTAWAQERERQVAGQRLGQLTAPERVVLRFIFEGKTNKAIASNLGVSLRTIEARRHRIFEKMQVKSLPGLIQQVLVTEQIP